MASTTNHEVSAFVLPVGLETPNNSTHTATVWPPLLHPLCKRSGAGYKRSVGYFTSLYFVTLSYELSGWTLAQADTVRPGRRWDFIYDFFFWARRFRWRSSSWCLVVDNNVLYHCHVCGETRSTFTCTNMNIFLSETGDFVLKGKLKSTFQFQFRAWLAVSSWRAKHTFRKEQLRLDTMLDYGL